MNALNPPSEFQDNEDTHASHSKTLASHSKPGTVLKAIGPTGDDLTIENLPPANTTRWVARRKAEVVAAVHTGLITLDQACQRYSLSIDEFRTWQRLISHHGLKGLRVTRVKQYRKLPSAG